MEKEKMMNGIQTVLSILDADAAPEARDYLGGLLFDEDAETDPFTVANKLLQCDMPEPLPEVLRDFIEALFTAAYDDGNADAMNDIGAQYYDGSRGFDQDFTKAVECYKLAAEKGSRQAQENLGY